MNLFYAAEINGQFYDLDKEESKHIIRVLRKKTGDTIHFTDGKGWFYETIISHIDGRSCTVEILKRYEGNDRRPFKVHIAIAPTKNNDRMEWFLEKATEIGIDEITPIICYHSERKVVKIERLNKVITSAIKQSLKSFHPKLNEQINLKEFLNKEFTGQKFIAYIDKDVTLELSNSLKSEGDILILIGPEGDFRPEEVELAKQKGFVPVSLGKSRLRTETAGVVACHTVSLLKNN